MDLDWGTLGDKKLRTDKGNGAWVGCFWGEWVKLDDTSCGVKKETNGN